MKGHWYIPPTALSTIPSKLSSAHSYSFLSLPFLFSPPNVRPIPRGQKKGRPKAARTHPAPQRTAPEASSKIPPEPTHGRHSAHEGTRGSPRHAARSVATSHRAYQFLSRQAPPQRTSQRPSRCTAGSGRFRPSGYSRPYAIPITAACTRGRPARPRRSRSARRSVLVRRFRASSATAKRHGPSCAGPWSATPCGPIRYSAASSGSVVR